MRKWIEEWIEDRTGLSKLLKVMLDEPVHGGANGHISLVVDWYSFSFSGGYRDGIVRFLFTLFDVCVGERLLHSTQNVLWLVCTGMHHFGSKAP